MSDQDGPHRPIGYIDRNGNTIWDECETCYGQGWPCETVQKEGWEKSMTDQDNLRNRIECVLHRTTGSDWHETAQAIIDELGLTVERSMVSHEVHDDGTWTTWPSQTRTVGKWEPECPR